MQKARRQPELDSDLRPLVGVWFQVLFTPLLGVLFTFPSQYWFTIGLSGVFSLARWCWQFQTGFHQPRPTQDTDQYTLLSCVQDYHLLWLGFPTHSTFGSHIFHQSYNPSRLLPRGLGCSAFARHYLRNHSCFLLLRLLRCFSSPGSLSDCSE